MFFEGEELSEVTVLRILLDTLFIDRPLEVPRERGSVRKQTLPLDVGSRYQTRYPVGSRPPPSQLCLICFRATVNNAVVVDGTIQQVYREFVPRRCATSVVGGILDMLHTS